MCQSKERILRQSVNECVCTRPSASRLLTLFDVLLFVWNSLLLSSLSRSDYEFRTEDEHDKDQVALQRRLSLQRPLRISTQLDGATDSTPMFVDRSTSMPGSASACEVGGALSAQRSFSAAVAAAKRGSYESINSSPIE